MRWIAATIILSAGNCLGLGCVHVHVDPIYAKLDVNIKVDQELDSFFDAVAKNAGTPASAPAVAAPAPKAAETKPVEAPSAPASIPRPEAPSADLPVPPPPAATAPADSRPASEPPTSRQAPPLQ